METHSTLKNSKGSRDRNGDSRNHPEYRIQSTEDRNYCMQCGNLVNFREEKSWLICPVCSARYRLVELDLPEQITIPEDVIPAEWLIPGASS